MVTTDDGVGLVVHTLAGPRDAPCTVVVLHGFAHWSRTPAVHRFAHELARRFDVVVPDLRGHGRSGGHCGFGPREAIDVERVVVATSGGAARPVVTVGVSLGAAVALLHAAASDSVAGVVAISPPARWSTGNDGNTGPTARIARWIGSRPRRAALRIALRTRVSDTLPGTDATVADVAPAIANPFVILVADPADGYFPPEHAQEIHDHLATDDKHLWWMDGAGHGSDLLSADLAARIGDEIERRVSPRRCPSR
ncbi:MAG TPA: alpha/beta fold hydrolase [Acidimicrobiales bacterium]|nr:alpha/beta fold hydrolase [Acidimicrobiales bacterium]